MKILFADDNGAERPREGEKTPGLITVLLAEGNTAMRQDLKALLEREPDLEVVAEAGDGATAIRLAQELSPQVVVLDAALPAVNGLEITTQILAKSPQTKIVILTLYGDRRLLANLLRLGASGYLLKDWAFEDLARSLRTVAAQKIYLSPEILNLALRDYVEILRNGKEDVPPDQSVKEAQGEAMPARAKKSEAKLDNTIPATRPPPPPESGANLPFKDLQERLKKRLTVSQIKMD